MWATNQGCKRLEESMGRLEDLREKKMCHNKKENQKTGGGEYNKYILTDIEESLARISGIYKSVDGISGSKSFAEFDPNLYFNALDKENEELDVQPSTSKIAKRGYIISEKRQISRSSSPDPKRSKCCNSDLRAHTPCTPRPDPDNSPLPPTTPPFISKRAKPQTPSKPDVNSLLVEENQHLKNIVQVMSEKLSEEKKITQLMEEQRDQMVVQNQMLNMLCDTLKKHFDAKEKNDNEVRKILCEKNAFKIKLIELETLKLELEQKRAQKL